MEVFKKYRNSIWRVPLISLAAGIFYHPIYIRAVLQFCVTEPGVIDRRGALMIDAAILAVVLIAGKMTLLRRQSKKEILISAGVVSAYGILLLLRTAAHQWDYRSCCYPVYVFGYTAEMDESFYKSFLLLTGLFSDLRSYHSVDKIFVPFLFVLLGFPKNRVGGK